VVYCQQTGGTGHWCYIGGLRLEAFENRLEAATANTVEPTLPSHSGFESLESAKIAVISRISCHNFFNRCYALTLKNLSNC